MENLNEVQKICIDVFDVVSKTTSLFVLPLFMGQIAFANISGEGGRAFTALKGVLIYFCLIAGFPMIFEVLFSIPETFLPRFQGIDDMQSQFANTDALSILPSILDRMIEVILSLLYWVVYYLHIFFMLLMSSMAPIVFLGGSVLGVGLGLELFLGLLIVGSSWPIIWYGFDQVHIKLMSAQSDQFGIKCLELLITILKGLAPVTFASAAIKSPAGKMATGAAKLGIQTASKPFMPARSFSPPTPTFANHNRPNRIPQTSEIGRRFLTQTAPRSKFTIAADRLKRAKDQFVSLRKDKGNEGSYKRNSKA